VFAQISPSIAAVKTLPTCHTGCHHDTIAGLQTTGSIGENLFDDAGEFVSHNERCFDARITVLPTFQVCPAYGTRIDVNQHFTGSALRHWNFFNPDVAGSMINNGLHRLVFFSVGMTD
jgi:hypothetical protein